MYILHQEGVFFHCPFFTDLFIIIFILWRVSEKNYNKYYKHINTIKSINYNIKIKCLKNCLKTYGVDINNPNTLQLVYNEYNFFYLQLKVLQIN